MDKKLRELTVDEVTFEVTYEPEFAEVEGSQESGDPEYAELERQEERDIIARLERDDMAAWFVVVVEARWMKHKAYASCGQLSFESFAEFERLEQNDLLEELRHEALTRLNGELSKEFTLLSALAT